MGFADVLGGGNALNIRVIEVSVVLRTGFEEGFKLWL